MPWSPVAPAPPPVLEVPGWFARLAFIPTGIPSAEAFGTPLLATVQAVIAAGIASGEAMGTVVVRYNQFVAPAGIASLEAFGGSVTNPGSVQVLPMGIATQEAFGGPTVTPGEVLIQPTGIIQYGMGVPTVSAGPVDISPSGIASAEAFGGAVLSYIVAPAGILSQESFGPVLITTYVVPGGVPSGEAFGTTNVAGGLQNIVPTGIVSAEAFGGSVTNPGAVLVTPNGIVTTEAFGTAVVGRGPVNVAPAGTISGEAFGTVQVNRTISVAGIVSAESVGSQQVNMNVVVESGIASAEAFGSATVDRALAAQTTYINDAVTGASASTSITLPAHQIGDVILIFSSGVGSTVPSAPSAGGTVPTWTTLDSQSNPNGVTSFRLCGTFATATNHTSGTWSQSGSMIAVVIRGASPSAPIGGLAKANGTGATSGAAPAITLSNSDGTSQILHFFTSSGGSSWPSTPAGYTKQRGLSYGLGFQGVCLLKKTSTTSDGSVTQQFGLTGTWQAVSIEIKAY